MIFMNSVGQYSDAELLGEFGITKAKPINEPPERGPHATFCTCKSWTVLIDDWYYSLWHSETTRPAIRRLAQNMDIYACSVGECDNSYDFIYYRNGARVREYVVVDPDMKSSIVKVDFGDPLPGETETLAEDDPCFGMLTIPVALGIPVPANNNEYRLYSHSASWVIEYCRHNS